MPEVSFVNVTIKSIQQTVLLLIMSLQGSHRAVYLLRAMPVAVDTALSGLTGFAYRFKFLKIN